MSDSLKKYFIAGFFFVATTGTLCHFVFEWSGHRFLAGLFCPVNESTWEHIKLLFFPALVYIVFLSFRFKNHCPSLTNALFFGLLLGCLSIPVLFYTYSGILGTHVFFMDIFVFLASTAIFFTASWKVLCKEWPDRQEKLLFILIAALFTAFIVFSYLPLPIGIFNDPASIP